MLPHPIGRVLVHTGAVLAHGGLPCHVLMSFIAPLNYLEVEVPMPRVRVQSLLHHACVALMSSMWVASYHVVIVVPHHPGAEIRLHLWTDYIYGGARFVTSQSA